ncbi:hypothetical protein PybrP1_007372 [[Pythium] brassicae (nom. inval.)]|nr:hypothetical protein PybrP1_007372 [[Pythium] brassicae (nom. inval.)]
MTTPATQRAKQAQSPANSRGSRSSTGSSASGVDASGAPRSHTSSPAGSESSRFSSPPPQLPSRDLTQSGEPSLQAVTQESSDVESTQLLDDFFSDARRAHEPPVQGGDVGAGSVAVTHVAVVQSVAVERDTTSRSSSTPSVLEHQEEDDATHATADASALDGAAQMQVLRRNLLHEFDAEHAAEAAEDPRGRLLSAECAYEADVAFAGSVGLQEEPIAAPQGDQVAVAMLLEQVASAQAVRVVTQRQAPSYSDWAESEAASEQVLESSSNVDATGAEATDAMEAATLQLSAVLDQSEADGERESEEQQSASDAPLASGGERLVPAREYKPNDAERVGPEQLPDDGSEKNDPRRRARSSVAKAIAAGVTSVFALALGTNAEQASDALQRQSSYYFGSALDWVKSAAACVAHALANLWERVLPSSRDADAVAMSRAELLRTLDADQRRLNEKLQALMRKQEAWALAELQRMKTRRALHASTAESVLTSTRSLVLEAVHGAKVVAEHHVESYSETVADELLQSIQREQEAHEQRVAVERQAAAQEALEQETAALESTAARELDAMAQEKADAAQVLDGALREDAARVAATTDALARELAAAAEHETQQIEAAYARVRADVASKLQDVVATIDREDVGAVVADAEARLEDEDAQLLAELEALEALAASRVAAEHERARAAATVGLKQQEAQLRHERAQVEARARALEAEEQRVAAERERVEQALAEAARRDTARLEAERRETEAALLEAHEVDHVRIRAEALNAAAELAQIKQEEEARARAAQEEAVAAAAEAARVEELRVQRELDALQARLAEEAAAEEARLRAERVAAEDTLERVLREEREEILTQLEESEQLVREVAAAAAGAADVVEPPQALLPSDQETVDVLAPEVESVASIVPSLPRIELGAVVQVATVVVVLAAVAAWLVRVRQRRRHRARAAAAARRKRWARSAADSDSDSVEEVVLLALASPGQHGREPEPESLRLSETHIVESEASSSEPAGLGASLIPEHVATPPNDSDARNEEVVEVTRRRMLHADAEEEADDDVECVAPQLSARSPTHKVIRRRSYRASRTTTTTTFKAALAGDAE